MSKQYKERTSITNISSIVNKNYHMKTKNQIKNELRRALFELAERGDGSDKINKFVKDFHKDYVVYMGADGEHTQGVSQLYALRQLLIAESNI